MRRLLRSNSKMFITICILSSFVIGLSYAAFKVNSTSYKATNMMVSKLMYGISISEINKSTSTINGNVVTIPAGTKSYFYVTISSINKIESKYAFAYASTNSVEVKYSSESESTPTEEIEGYTTTDTYSNTIKISIDNRNNSSSTTVTLNAFGGYTHNDYTSIILGSGYTLIEGSYEEGKDINLISYTVDGKNTDLSYQYLAESNEVNSIICENGSTAVWNETDKSIKFTNIKVPDYCVIDFKGYSLKQAMLRDNPAISEREDFGTVFQENTTGVLFTTNFTEDLSTVYYYSGNTDNNWVSFAGFYWRIIRTNEDGSVRLLFAGDSINSTNAYIDTNLYSYNGIEYGDSIIKQIIDSFYKSALFDDYDSYISKEAIYCNDKNDYNGELMGAVRLVDSYYPSYICGGTPGGPVYDSEQSYLDKYSVGGDGNGELTYPIGLMTADEVAFAGGSYDMENSYVYYYFNSKHESSVQGSYDDWWLMTPVSVTDTIMFKVSGSTGKLSYSNGYSGSAIRPVISISSCAKVSGTGTPTDPYIIDESASTC